MTWHRQTIYDYFQMIRNIHVVNHGKPDSINYKILDNGSKLILLIVKSFSIMCCGTGFAIVLSPVPLYILNGELVEIYPLFFPFFDENTFYGYIGSTSCQFFYVILGSIGKTGSDLLFIVPVLYVLPLIELFRARFDELNVLLEMGDSAKNSESVYRCVRNIVQMHQEMCM